MLIRTTRVEDADALADLHLDVWDEAYRGLIADDILAARRARRAERVESWRGILSRGENQQLVADDDGRLIGFATVGTGVTNPSPVCRHAS